MTIEECIGFDAAKLEALSVEDLKKHFDHYLIITRPENAPRAIQQEQRVLTLDPKFAAAQKIAAGLGIQLQTFKPLKGGRK